MEDREAVPEANVVLEPDRYEDEEPDRYEDEEPDKYEDEKPDR